MINIVSEMLSFPFMQRAIIIGLLISIASSLVGVNLVLKRYSMIGDGLSHVGFGALSIAIALGTRPLFVAIIACVLGSFLLLRLSDRANLKGDAAVALLSTTSLAAGIMAISLTSGINTDVCNFMFGTMLAMNPDEIILSVVLIVAVIIVYMLGYNNFFLFTFDEEFAKASGRPVNVYKSILSVLVAITVVIGMKMMGALMISSLIIFPAITAMQLSKTFKKTSAISVVVSVFCFSIGVVAAYQYELPTGATIVLIHFTVFIISAVFRRLNMKAKN